jgi:hypothetical protein
MIPPTRTVAVAAPAVTVKDLFLVWVVCISYDIQKIETRRKKKLSRKRKLERERTGG